MSTPLRLLAAMFDVDTGQATTKLKELSGTLDTAKGALKTLAAGALGAFSIGAVKSFIEENIRLGDELDKTSQKLGVTTDELQKFRYSADGVGVGEEAASQALAYLNKNLGAAITGSKEAAQTFASLGVNLEDVKSGSRSATDILPQIADQFATLGSDAERTDLAMKLFGKSGASLIPLLKQGGAAVANASKEFEEFGLGIDQDFIDKSAEAVTATSRMRLGFRALKTQIAVALLPGFTDFATKLTRWIKVARDYARETNVVKVALTAFGTAGSLALAKIGMGWLKTFGLLKKAGGIASFFELGALGLIIGALVLIGLAIEDIVTMVQGGESVIGDFLEEMLGFGEKQKLIDSLTAAWEAMQPAIDDLKPLVTDIGLAFAKALPYAIALVVDAIKVVTTLGSAIGTVISSIAQAVSGDVEGAGMRMLKGQGDIEKIWKSGLTTWKLATAPDPPSVPQSAAFGPPPPPGTGGVRTGDIKIEVKGGPTNADTGAAVRRGVTQGLGDVDRRAAAHALYRGGDE